MAEQPNLWVAEARPLSIVLKLEHDWLISDQALTASVVVHGTKGPSPRWATAQQFTGEHAGAVARCVLEGELSRFLSPRWGAENIQLTQQEWEQHLHTF